MRLLGIIYFKLKFVNNNFYNEFIKQIDIARTKQLFSNLGKKTDLIKML